MNEDTRIRNKSFGLFKERTLSADTGVCRRGSINFNMGAFAIAPLVIPPAPPPVPAPLTVRLESTLTYIWQLGQPGGGWTAMGSTAALLGSFTMYNPVTHTTYPILANVDCGHTSVASFDFFGVRPFQGWNARGGQTFWPPGGWNDGVTTTYVKSKILFTVDAAGVNSFGIRPRLEVPPGYGLDGSTRTGVTVNVSVYGIDWTYFTGAVVWSWTVSMINTGYIYNAAMTYDSALNFVRLPDATDAAWFAAPIIW